MATQQAEAVIVNDITVCSICFEKFKIPRYLPCKHSFCQDCLCSYIVSQCKSTEPRLGFHCPLCRQFILSNGDVLDKPEEWAGHFPVNNILQKLISQSGEKHCEPCARNEEDAEVTTFCMSCNEYLCELCTKYHAKILALNDHKILKLRDMETNETIPVLGIVNKCPKHQDEPAQLFCSVHEQPCCFKCGAIVHKKCTKVDEIKIAGQVMKETGTINSLLTETKAFKEKLLCAKAKEENNISEIEKKVDEERSYIDERFTLTVKHLEGLKNKYLDDLSSTLKKGRQVLQTEVERLDEGVLGVDLCTRALEDALEAGDEIETVMKYHNAHAIFQNVKKCRLKETIINIERSENSTWPDMLNIKSFAVANFVKREKFFDDFDVGNIELSVFKEVTFDDDEDISYGLLLSDGKFIFVDKGGQKCLIYDDQWNYCDVIELVSEPYGVAQCDEEIFVTTTHSREIEVFSSRHFQKLRNISVPYIIYGITSRNSNLYVTCGKKILKIDDKQNVKELKVDCTCHYHIITTKSGLIIYSDSGKNVIVALTDEGDSAWEYRSPNLKHPAGLDVDSCDQIYVAGMKSNNVHVLSDTGTLIRLIESISGPKFFKINETSRTVCVCSNRSDSDKIIVYKF